MVKGGSVPIRSVAMAGEKTAGRVIATGAKRVGEEVAGKTLGRAALEESLILLRNAGIKVAKGSLSVAQWAARNPGKVVIVAGSTATALCALYPDKAADIIDNGSRWVGNRLAVLAEKTGRAVASLPGALVKGVLDKTRELSAAEPILAPIFYALAAALIAVIFLLPFYLLKRLVPELYEFLEDRVVETYRVARRVVAWSTKRAARILRPAA
jgi:hypothetical protein